jgi:hypothetical protein
MITRLRVAFGSTGCLVAALCGVSGCNPEVDQAPSQPWLAEVLETSERHYEEYWSHIPAALQPQAKELADRLLAIATAFGDDCCSLYDRDPSPLLKSIVYNIIDPGRPPTDVPAEQLVWTWNALAAADCEAELQRHLAACVLPKDYRDPDPFLTTLTLYDACRNIIRYREPGEADPSCYANIDCRYWGHLDRDCHVAQCLPRIEVGVGESCNPSLDATSVPACSAELDCDGSICTALTELGGDCRGRECVTGAHCSAEDVCVPGPFEGERCLAGTVCADGSACVVTTSGTLCSFNPSNPGETCADGDACHWGLCEDGVCQVAHLLWCMPSYLDDIEPYRAGARPHDL